MKNKSSSYQEAHLGQSLYYKKHRLGNYIILNFSRKCSFINEIGINISQDNKITITANGKSSEKYRFENEVSTFKSSIEFKNYFDYLNKSLVDIKFNYISESFKNDFIEDLTLYYFVPLKSDRQYIFKYYSYNENLKKTLNNNTLWFSDPKKFNDPFDCRYSIDADPTDFEVLMFYYNEIKKKQPITVESFIKTFNYPDRKDFLDFLEEHHFNNSISKYGICCFTEKYNNKLMWSHYAEKYCGICLVFDTRKNSSIYTFKSDRVKYRKSFVKKFYDGTKYFDITDILFSKNMEWNYEEEVREIIWFGDSDTTDRAIQFDPKHLVGIIFGAKMESKQKEEIKILINSLDKYNIELIDSYIDYKDNSIKLKENNLLLV